MIQNRIIQPRQRIQVWYYPSDGESGWKLKGAFEYPFQAYIARLEVSKEDPQAEYHVTKLIDLDVKIEEK